MRSLIGGQLVRLGAYGDPCAVPVGVWRKVLALAKRHTGYTHQWKGRRNSEYASFLMASVDSDRDRGAARLLGWRTFRVRSADAPVQSGEITCPASDEAGYRRSCASCLACHGAERPGKVDVVIIGHGGIGVLPNIKRNLEAVAN